MDELSVASFNLHVGVNGWGVPYDVIGACAALDADVLVLEEAFSSDASGRSLADEVATTLGYEIVSTVQARARRLILEETGAGRGERRWGPRRSKSARAALRIDPPRRQRALVHSLRARRAYEQGTWDLAVLSRAPICSSQVRELPRLRRDAAHRHVIVVEVAVNSTRWSIAGTHLAHLSAGSALQIRALARILSEIDGPGALAGDTNCFGPLLSGLIPGWRRAPKGRTWPSWRPLCQPDHILANRDTEVLEADVLRLGNSDHLPVRARLAPAQR